MRVGEAQKIVGELSVPSKMPGYAWSIPPTRCITGYALQKIPGSTCADCYAMKGRYSFPVVKDAMERRYQAMQHPQWKEAMIVLMHSQAVASKGYFRWFDAGDLQSSQHLADIFDICRASPHLRFWMPTREARFLKGKIDPEQVPENLIIRLSAPMIDQASPSWWPWSSGVAKDADPLGYYCPAPQQKNSCGDCRACWDRRVPHVSYHHH